ALKRMKRGGGADVFLHSIEKMRRAIPDVTLRTSFIVGFPGETEREFEELCDFVREAEFDWMGAFGYSDQEGARAHDLEKKVPEREIEHRRKQLMKIQQSISKRRKNRLIGREFDLLLEGSSEETDLLLEGRTAMHAPEIDGKVFVNEVPEGLDTRPGEFYRCEIVEAHDYDLVAKIVASGNQLVAGQCRAPHGAVRVVRILCRVKVPSNFVVLSARKPSRIPMRNSPSAARGVGRLTWESGLPGHM